MEVISQFKECYVRTRSQTLKITHGILPNLHLDPTFTHGWNSMIQKTYPSMLQAPCTFKFNIEEI